MASVHVEKKADVLQVMIKDTEGKKFPFGPSSAGYGPIIQALRALDIEADNVEIDRSVEQNAPES